ncbi:AraC family transcriptional regulator [Pseudoalteromonas luteoviolacea]|uniref:helix-turn-helix transcriptional regulator n=1 Tax=Pseudoalteromonas luteoviolacea TaxID=43657 RepID=UPI001F27597A|nr:AraC family transcriptional regulator [Pseudoalteromonas luteoviolacea]MCF6441884.1 AraC family transcriptional regulator [Pseudoalteromonas luteoviolacea]
MQQNVWIKTGYILLYGASIDAIAHQHVAMQVVCPDRDSTCILAGKTLHNAVIIDSNTPHCLKMESGWVLLVEPHSVLGACLKAQLSGQPLKVLSISATLQPLLSQSDAITVFFKAFSELIQGAQMFDNQLNTITDPRISRLLSELNSCFDGQCIKPLQWRAKEVAHKYHLSESRFLHLFSEQVGIAWRPYLLWRRMLCALLTMQKGASATEAAFSAGFSDSAHLSRTFKNTFGMTIRQAISLFK